MGVDSYGMGKGFVVVSSSTKAGLVVGHSSSTGKGFVVVSFFTKTGLVVWHSSSGKVWSSSPPSQKQGSWCGTRPREMFCRRLLLHKSRTRGGTLVLNGERFCRRLLLHKNRTRGVALVFGQGLVVVSSSTKAELVVG